MDMGALFIATNHALGNDRMRISGRNTKKGENNDNVSPRPTVLHTLNRGSFTPANRHSDEQGTVLHTLNRGSFTPANTNSDEQGQ